LLRVNYQVQSRPGIMTVGPTRSEADLAVGQLTPLARFGE